MAKSKTAKPQSVAVEPAMASARRTYDRLIANIQPDLDAGEVNTTLLRDVTSLIRAAADLDSKAAAIQRANDRAAKSLREPLVVRYLSLLSDADWSHVRQLVESAREGKAGSVLA